MCFIRAGMVAGRNIAARGSEHRKGSMLSTASATDSKFYNSYPSRAAGPKATNAARKGWHDNLQQRVALGYPLGKSVSDLVELFGLTEADNNNINKLNFRVKEGAVPKLEDKQRRALHYMGELAYGLCLAPSDNISSNPGWEQALKQYTGKQ